MPSETFGLCMNRRTVLALTGGSLAVPLSGCLGNDSDGNGDETPKTEQDETPADTPTDESNDKGTDEPNTGGGETPEETPTDDGTDQQEPTETDDGESPSDVSGEPKKTLDEYVAAVNEGDKERAMALVHEDGNQDEEDVTSDISYFEDREISLVDRTIIQVEDGEVVVRGILQIGEEGSEDANKIGLQMRLRRGETDDWLIYEGKGYQLEGESEEESQ
jgi:hypothetical protein